ncbi:DUF192 domain-containing protein [Candidatus Pacearchaeota archaeon]|nr:DUF192 domain-containing protein [Candidatus Pacearchaeota archaeon]
MRIYNEAGSCDLDAKRLSFLGKATGLMFKSSSTQNLLFEFNGYVRASITSWFVFFPFMAIWLDDKNRILEWKVVDPFVLRILPKEKFRKLVEVPLHERNRKILDFVVGKRKGLNRAMIRNS